MKLGLSLAGGGIKGIAHIGAIKALEEENIKFDYIAGTSSGSIVATLYACGYTVNEMYNIFKEYAKDIKYVDLKNGSKLIFDLLFKRKIEITGLNSGRSLHKLVKKICSSKGIYNICQIEKPLLIPAVNIVTEQLYAFYSKDIFNVDTKEIKYITDADISKVVQASCSYPGVFSPCEFEGELLVDGGIAENIPWRELKRIGADKVLSITFKNTKPKKCCKNLFEVIDKSFSVMCKELARHEISGTDFLIEIKHDNIGLLDCNKLDELFTQGYYQTKQQIKQIKLIKQF